MATPTLDIIVPSTGSADELDACLSALDAYTSPLMHKHWIICDDAGKTDVEEVARFFAQSRSMITVIRNEKKLYSSRTVNRCLERTRARQHVICHTNVIVEDKGFLDKLLYPFMRDPKATVCVADVYCDWNSLAPRKHSRQDPDLEPNLWAVTRAGISIFGYLPEEVMDSLAFPSMINRAIRSTNVWVVPSVRTVSRRIDIPERMPGFQELNRRAIAHPTVLVEK